MFLNFQKRGKYGPYVSIEKRIYDKWSYCKGKNHPKAIVLVRLGHIKDAEENLELLFSEGKIDITKDILDKFLKQIKDRRRLYELELLPDIKKNYGNEFSERVLKEF
ncbi:hypothetical protein [Desulfolucanica intricata]|uniref:hypothetical protein n=1 Tax=Desulfolucanica intricata TaxID=1285191 RepID=UPI00083291F5|nr:hypothetical protein [Desulfolucanica intricata]